MTRTTIKVPITDRATAPPTVALAARYYFVPRRPKAHQTVELVLAISGGQANIIQLLRVAVRLAGAE
jgi:hypothetical protein